MSFWKELFSDKKGPLSFLWMINELGNVVVARTEQVSLQPGDRFTVADNWRHMVSHMLAGSDFVKPHVFSGEILGDWQEIVGVLNGKPCTKRTEFMAIHFALNRMGVESPLDFDWSGGKRVNWRLRERKSP